MIVLKNQNVPISKAAGILYKKPLEKTKLTAKNAFRYHLVQRHTAGTVLLVILVQTSQSTYTGGWSGSIPWHGLLNHVLTRWTQDLGDCCCWHQTADYFTANSLLMSNTTFWNNGKNYSLTDMWTNKVFIGMTKHHVWCMTVYDQQYRSFIWVSPRMCE